MRAWLALLLTMGAAALALGAANPAAAQFSAGYKFLEAVKKADGNKVTEALSDPASTLVNSRDISSGETALHIVVARRDSTWVRFLLAKGANPNVADKRGETPLGLAVSLGFLEGVEALLDSGANPNSTSATGETPLITATLMGNKPMMKAIMKKGGDPDRADRSGRSARHYAEQGGRRTGILDVIEEHDAEAKARPSYGPTIN